MRRTFLLSLAAITTVLVLAPIPVTAHPDGPSAQASSRGTPFASSPEAGSTGSVIEVSGEGCLLPRSDVPGEGVVVRLVSEGDVHAFDTFAVAPDGTWSGRLEVFAGTPARRHNLQARCVYPGEPDPVVYQGRSFTVTGEGADAEAAPATPRFNGGIEPFPEYDGQTTCSPNIKPGMSRFMNMVRANYGGGSLGVSRACGAGGTSEHKEGRAWDWAMNANSAGDRARVQSLMNWMFATDARCNRYARARRLGMMYIIWNRRMFRMYDVARGWAPYSGSNPHTDHVHFSLTRDGGSGRVSFYNPVYQAPRGWSPGSRRNRDHPVAPKWDGVAPLSGDFDGNGLDDLLWYAADRGVASVWYSRPQGGFATKQVTMGPGRMPVVGDFNGDCRSDIVWYQPGNAPDRQWQGKPNRTFRVTALNIAGTFAHGVSGDFNGDRVDDILWYNPGTGADRLWQGSAFGFVKRNVRMGGNFEPFAGDFDGDFKDDVFWYSPGQGNDRVWYGKRNGFVGRRVNMTHDLQAIPGDFNGDDRTDVLWYGPGGTTDRMWLGRRARGFAVNNNVNMSRQYASAVALDIDGDTFDDVFWHDSPAEAHKDRFWLY